MIVTSMEKGLLMGIAVADSALFITGVWSFIICYVFDTDRIDFVCLL